MSEHSIEFLGQKFSYPSTWQGAFSVFVVCTAITTTAITLSPEQVNAIGSLIGNDSEETVVSLTDKLSKENLELRKQVLWLAETPDISREERQEVVSKVKDSAEEIDQTYAAVIDKQIEKSQAISTALPNTSGQQQQVLSAQQARIIQLTGQLQQQQQMQQQIQ
ncbi:hypothetical protein NBRC116494_37760 [Aurantivibrio plasticivorans]